MDKDDGKRRLTDPKEFEIIRDIYFPEEIKDIDRDELDERLLARRKCNTQSK